MGSYCVLEYQYRDAGNYKSWGEVLLAGEWTEQAESQLRARCEDGLFFVAEQVGLPALYEELWQYSNGITEDDLPYHEICSLRPALEDEALTMVVWSKLESLIERFQEVEGKWNASLSPHGKAKLQLLVIHPKRD